MVIETAVTLILQEPNGTDSSGNPLYTETSRTVFATKKAVRQTEYFQAAALGFKPEVVLEVHSFDYCNEEFCELDGERFRIYRVYPVGKTERVELYLTAIVGDSNAFA